MPAKAGIQNHLISWIPALACTCPLGRNDDRTCSLGQNMISSAARTYRVVGWEAMSPPLDAIGTGLMGIAALNPSYQH